MPSVRQDWHGEFDVPYCPLTEHRQGDHLTAVDNLADVFKAVGDPRDIDVICATCNVSAWP
jgi:hypothetical protein